MPFGQDSLCSPVLAALNFETLGMKYSRQHGKAKVIAVVLAVVSLIVGTTVDPVEQSLVLELWFLIGSSYTFFYTLVASETGKIEMLFGVPHGVFDINENPAMFRYLLWFQRITASVCICIILIQ